MSLWEAIALGIIQGLTEFLPISSTAHLVVARQLMGHDNPRDAFTTAIQLGTLVAVFAYFRNDIQRLLIALWGDIRQGRFGTSPEAWLCWKIAVGSIPVVACGYAFKEFIKTYLYTLPVIAGAAIVFALLLWQAEVIAKRRQTAREHSDIRWWDALIVGCFQTLALIPGASRSGTTITAGLFVGLSRPAAARFSFLLSLPSIMGAGLYELYKDGRDLLAQQDQAVNLIVSAVVAGLVGYASIAWLLGFLSRHSTYVFIIYRLLLGTLIIVLLLMGVIHDSPTPNP
jgi:undecaprenyl-diphosphatase